MDPKNPKNPKNPNDHRGTRETRSVLGARPRGARVAAASLCAPWAALLPDAAEGLLSDAEQRALDYHLAGCAACSLELTEAQHGLAWLAVLKDHTPAPPAGMLASILAQTTGMEETGVMLPPLASTPVPVAAGGGFAGLGAWERMRAGVQRWLLQPQLAMTAAMAFFSICVTLNLLGISVGRPDGQGFRGGGLQRTVADQRASLLRSIEGLRVVYRVESRVNQMRAEMNDPGDGRPAQWDGTK